MLVFVVVLAPTAPTAAPVVAVVVFAVVVVVAIPMMNINEKQIRCLLFAGSRRNGTRERKKRKRASE